MFRRDLRYFVSAVCLLAFAAPVPAADEALPRDDNNRYGKLANGLSYIIREHKNPPERIAVYLHVQTGALNETDKQNGLAHFLEHMAFNGSKHFAPGELIPYMSKLGMRFGADSNAHTDHKETVYKLFMPDVKEETITQVMTIMSDFANGLLLLEEEINKERQVILEEMRARKSAMERIQKQWLRELFAGSRVAVHDVIGDEEQIKTFPRSEFEDYWNTWYRPDNMTLIVVGDVRTDAIEAEIKKHFAEFKPRGPARKYPGAGIRPDEASRAIILTDPEQVMCQVQVVSIKPGRPPMRTYEDFRKNEIENIGTWIVSRRLREMVDRGEAAFRGANVGVSDFFNECIVPTAISFGQPEEWNKMLEQVVMEISRAAEHGFTERELELAKQETISDAERRVEREPTLDASVIIGMTSRTIGQNEPLLSAKQRLALTQRALKDATLEEVCRVFVENFRNKAYTYVLMMPEKREELKLPTTDDVMAAAAAAWSRKTEPPRKEAAMESLLAKQPTPGKIASRVTDDDLKVTTAKLSNGVVVHHRFMDYEKEQVEVQVILPGGAIEETADNRGISEAAEVVFSRPATNRLDSTQMRDLMTGRKVRLNGNISMDTLSISLNASPADLEFGMELIYALLTDGKVEPAAVDNWKKMRLQRLEMMQKVVQGQLRRAMDETLFAGDVRLTELTPAQVNAIGTDAAQAWLRRITDKAAVEVTIVGDIPLDRALELAAKYLGALSERSSDFVALDHLRQLKRGPGPYAKDLVFQTVTPKGLAFAGFVGCEERDTFDRRALSMVSRILSERMIKRLREEEQLVYSIGCQSQPARGIPGLGLFIAAAPADPENTARLADEILEMMQDVAEKGPSDEEVETAAKQLITNLEKTMEEPDFWRNQLSESTYRGRKLEELKDLPGVYKTFTAKQLQEVARKYATPERRIRIVILPELVEAGKDEEKPAGDSSH